MAYSIETPAITLVETDSQIFFIVEGLGKVVSGPLYTKDEIVESLLVIHHPAMDKRFAHVRIGYGLFDDPPLPSASNEYFRRLKSVFLV